ncbi:hypothetical protein [Streptomyces sp. SYSU K21746]
MTHNIHTDAKPERRASRIATIVAATAVISGGVILPASAATPALSHPTAVTSFVTDEGDDSLCDCGGLTGETITDDGYGTGSLYGPEGGLIHPDRDVTSDAITDDYSDDSFLDPGEVYVNEEEF